MSGHLCAPGARRLSQCSTHCVQMLQHHPVGAEQRRLAVREAQRLAMRANQGLGATQIRFPNHVGIAGTVFKSLETVNIPHVIASFYDNNGKVVWVSDGYVEKALLPQSTEAFALEIPQSLAGKVQNFHVVVNQYSLQRS